MALDNQPTAPGFYWARSDCKWFNLIVNCIGEPPFMSLIAWDIKEDKLIRPLPLFRIDEWGTEIKRPVSI
jgi:hypothetical protein